jgi:hypothetical protein
VLATVHPRRGVDAVPVCFALAGDLVGVPVDRVKPKESVELQRIRNLERDNRAALLCDHWDGDDWSQLWWVRAVLESIDAAAVDRSILEDALRVKYVPYRQTEFASLLVFHLEELTGWSAAGDGNGSAGS